MTTTIDRCAQGTRACALAGAEMSRRDATRTPLIAIALRFAAEHALPHAQGGDGLGVRKACCKLPFLVELFRGGSSFRVVLAMNRGASAQQNGHQVQLRGTKTTAGGERGAGQHREGATARAMGRACVHRAANAPHHFVEIRPRHGERRHERLGERKWRAVDLELEDLDAVADEGDGVARVGRVRDDLGQGAGLEGLEVLRL